MKLSVYMFFSLLLLFNNLNAQVGSHSIKVNLTIDKAVQKSFNSKGRLFLFLNQSDGVEPMTQTWPSKGNYMFAKNYEKFDSKKSILIVGKDWQKTPAWDLEHVPSGTYYIQILWDQNTTESNINSEGNIYCEKQKVELNGYKTLEITLNKVIEPIKINEHPLVREISIRSDTLSKWWKKDVYVKASILLPSKYNENKTLAYPIDYNVAGYGGRYDRINRLTKSKRSMYWWTSADAPQIIVVMLDGEGPFGDSYQMDSDNSGAYGYSLIHELIPAIESKYRNTNSAATRFVEGCSTGGWVSLALQVYYPEMFNGCFSYSPDAVEFENYQLIDIYKDKNAFVNEFDYPRPVMRDISGEPMLALKEFINYENVLGWSDTYVTSGGQFSAHTALFSPKGKDGLPKPLFDPVTGDIDPEVAKTWTKYDMKKYLDKNWQTLGPKLQGKIYIWMGDMDHFYLNPATRALDEYLKTTKNPVSDANINFSPMEGHCAEYSFRDVMEKIDKKIKDSNLK